MKVQLKDSNPVIRIHAAIAIVKMDDNVGDDEIEAAFTDARLAPIALQGLEESS